MPFKKGTIPWNKGKLFSKESRMRMSVGQKKRFETEPPWNKGNRQSKEEKTKKKRKYYQNNKELILIKNKKYRENNFENYKIKKHEYYLNHKTEILQKSKEYSINNKEKVKLIHQIYYQTNKTDIQESFKKKYYEDDEFRKIHLEKQKQYKLSRSSEQIRRDNVAKKRYADVHKEEKLIQGRKYHKLNGEKIRKRINKTNRIIKLGVMMHYSKSITPKCACCKTEYFDWLTIDHIQGRKSWGHDRKMTGSRFYKWIIKNNYPKGFRVLCFNCNFSYGHHGYCPHNGNDVK